MTTTTPTHGQTAVDPASLPFPSKSATQINSLSTDVQSSVTSNAEGLFPNSANPINFPYFPTSYCQNSLMSQSPYYCFPSAANDNEDLSGHSGMETSFNGLSSQTLSHQISQSNLPMHQMAMFAFNNGFSTLNNSTQHTFGMGENHCMTEIGDVLPNPTV